MDLRRKTIDSSEDIVHHFFGDSFSFSLQIYLLHQIHWWIGFVSHKYESLKWKKKWKKTGERQTRRQIWFLMHKNAHVWRRPLFFSWYCLWCVSTSIYFISFQSIRTRDDSSLSLSRSLSPSQSFSHSVCGRAHNVVMFSRNIAISIDGKSENSKCPFRHNSCRYCTIYKQPHVTIFEHRRHSFLLYRKTRYVVCSASLAKCINASMLMTTTDDSETIDKREFKKKWQKQRRREREVLKIAKSFKKSVSWCRLLADASE